jgi:hypothetical protein
VPWHSIVKSAKLLKNHHYPYNTMGRLARR